MGGMEIRRLGPTDRDVLRAVRLRALADAPSAFGSTLAGEQAYSDAEWDGRLATPGSVTFVAVAPGGRPVGMVTSVPDPADRRVADLFGMWVAPEVRRRGVGDALVRRLLAWAEEVDVEVVRLCVTGGNDDAERLYRRHGFVRTGYDVVRDRDGCSEIGMARRGKAEG